MPRRETLDRMIDLVGTEPIDKLIQHRGGWRITIPTHPTLVHPLAEVLGLEALYTLSYWFGGERLHIPTARTATQAERDAAIERDRAAGASLNELVARYGLGYSRIQKILRARRINPPSPEQMTA